MTPLHKGRYVLHTGAGADDLAQARALRALCFGTPMPDGDRFDAASRHMLIRDADTGALVCCFRLRLLNGATLHDSYAAQFYDLGRLAAFDGPMLELGRFCIHPDWQDPDILRLAWAGMTRIVDRDGVMLMFGCSSFAGTQAAVHRDAFGVLHARHLAPARWRPGVHAAETVPLGTLGSTPPDQKKAQSGMPPLLRTYLLMGGWVSDHAVIDRDLGTLHVFTGLEIGAIPENRKRLLRALV
ncbi:GNAT family N-acetyltransferase [Sulfitobacter sp. S190]|uniref:GNAT family N-acetyltransferase n=1 Tax=Sulfitobacter sp. S190 TaxID=2867022 RepID=UPI0021A5D80B|nr:GNAT family N-acetyltransferase [Sulfitobacter sp. S190]UWR23812.1 GNAT family N-acetyltransferase [Sulfitobacter sp. S190]